MSATLNWDNLEWLILSKLDLLFASSLGIKAGNQQFIILLGSEYFNCICCQIKLFLQRVPLRFCPCPCFVLTYLQSLLFELVKVCSKCPCSLIMHLTPSTVVCGLKLLRAGCIYFCSGGFNICFTDRRRWLLWQFV